MSASRLLLGLIALFGLSACFFKVYSRRDRFVDQVTKLSQSQANSTQLLGKPNATKTRGSGAIALKPGALAILRVGLPKTYDGYCESLTVHVPKYAEHEGEYRVWIGPTPRGPWLAVGRALKSKTFDIDELPFSSARYVKIQNEPKSGRDLWLDALHVRVHLPRWRPYRLRPLPARASAAVVRRAQKRALAAYKAGKALLEKEKHKQALNKFREALPRMPRHADLAYSMAAAYFGLEQHYQSIRSFEYGEALKPPNALQLEEYGQSFLALRQLRQALKAFDRCTARAPLRPRCYKHKIHATSLMTPPPKALIELYKDQYLIVKYRSHVRYRKWMMARLFAVIYRRNHTPYIVKHPQRFSPGAHASWFAFLKGLFPDETRHILQESTSSLKRLGQQRPQQQWDSALHQAIIAHQAGDKSHSMRLFRKLGKKARTPRQRAQLYLTQSDLALRTGQRKAAIAYLRQGLRRLGKGERSRSARARLQSRLDRLTFRVPVLDKPAPRPPTPKAAKKAPKAAKKAPKAAKKAPPRPTPRRKPAATAPPAPKARSAPKKAAPKAASKAQAPAKKSAPKARDK